MDFVPSSTVFQILWSQPLWDCHGSITFPTTVFGGQFMSRVKIPQNPTTTHIPFCPPPPPKISRLAANVSDHASCTCPQKYIEVLELIKSGTTSPDFERDEILSISLSLSLRPRHSGDVDLSLYCRLRRFDMQTSWKERNVTSQHGCTTELLVKSNICFTCLGGFSDQGWNQSSREDSIAA